MFFASQKRLVSHLKSWRASWINPMNAQSARTPEGQLQPASFYLGHSAPCTSSIGLAKEGTLHFSFRELHHFCTISAPIFARSGKPPLYYQPLPKKTAPRLFVSRLHPGPPQLPSPPQQIHNLQCAFCNLH